MKSPLYYPLKIESISLQERCRKGIIGAAFLDELLVAKKLDNLGVSIIHSRNSRVTNGVLLGNSIDDLIEFYKKDFLGNNVVKLFGNYFPIEISIIEAEQYDSTKPKYNRQLGGEQFYLAKNNELFYVLEANSKSKIYCGFNDVYTQEYINSTYEKGELLNLLKPNLVKKGDGFLVKSRNIYAIDNSLELVKIQQLYNSKKELSKFEKYNANGAKVDLQKTIKMDALDFSRKTSKQITPKNQLNIVNKVLKKSFFTVNKLLIDHFYNRSIDRVNSFVIYFCTEGSAIIAVDNYEKLIKKGETFVIPALVDKFKITSTDAELLEIYI